MSGYRIPAEFDFGNSAERAQQLEAIFRRLISQANQLSGAFDKAGSSGSANADKAGQSLVKQLRDALTVLETTARSIQTVSAEVRALNAQSTAARNLARANREADVQAVSRSPVRRQIARTDNVDDVRTIETAVRRDLERLKASRRELTRIVQGSQEGDAAVAKADLARTNRQIRTARDALSRLDQRRDELLAIERTAASRQREIDNIRRRTGFNNDPEIRAGQDQLSLFGRFRRLRVDQAAEANPDFVAARDSVERQRRIASLQRRIAQAKDGEIQALQAQLDALKGPGGPTIAGAIQRLVVGSQALSQAATDPATRGFLVQGNLARMDLGTAAQQARYDDPAERARLMALRVEGARLSTEANLRLLESAADRARLVQLGVGRGGLNDEVAAARLSDPVAQQAAVRRRQAQAQVNVMADEGMDPNVQRRRGDLARAQSREFLFGDGGGSIFATQAQLLLNYTILGQIQGALTASVKAVVEFDNALKNLQAISGSTNGEMEKLTKTIQDVSLVTKFSAVELTQAATTMAQAGLGVAEIGSGLRAVALLATATGSEIGTAVDIATTALSVFRLRAEELPRVADQMTAALNLSKLTIEQVGLGFQYVGNTAADAGLSFAETTAALATLANQGIRSGSTLGTGFRQLLVDLQQPNENLSKRMRELGLTMADIDVRANGLSGVFQNLRDAGFTSADAFATIELRAAAAFSAFARGAQDMNDLQQGILNSSGAAQANAVQMESLTNRLLQLRNTINVLVFEAARPLVDMLKTMVTGINDVLSSATGASTTLQIFGGVIAALAISGAVRLLTGMAVSLIAVRNAALGAATATGALSAAIRAVPIIGWIAGLAGAMAMLVDFGGSTAKVAADLERTRQRVNEATASYERQRSALQSLDEFMNNVIRRTVALNNDQGLLNTTIAEARNRFGLLSTAVNGSVTSYGDLVSVLQQVRTELTSTLLLQARARAEATDQRVRELEAVAQAPIDARPWTRLVTDMGGSVDATSTYQRTLVQGSSAPGVTGQQLQAQAAFASFPQALRDSPEIKAAFEVLGRMGTIPSGELEQASRVLAQALARLSTARPEDLGVSQASRDRLAAFIETRTRSLADLSSARTEDRIAQSALRTYSFGASATGQDLSRSITDLNSEVTARLATISSNLPLSERQSALGLLRSFAERRVDEILRLAETEGADNPLDLSTGRTVGANFLSTNDAFSSVVGRLREAGVELDRRVARAVGQRTEAALSAAEREVQNAISAGRSVRDPQQARVMADAAEVAIRRAGQLELEQRRSQRRADNDREPMDPETWAVVTEEDSRAVAARVEQRVRETRAQVTEAAVQAIEVQLSEVRETLARLNQRGRPANPEERGRVQTQARELIEQIGRLRGESPETVASRINRFNSGQDRAEFRASRVDPRAADFDNYGAAIRNIERSIGNDRLAAETEPRSIRAQLDAARRVPERFSRGALIRLEKELNDAEIESERRVAESQRRRITELTELEREITPRLQTLRDAMRVRPDAAAPSTEETRELGQRIETLSNSLTQIRTLRENAEITIQQTEAIARARSSETSGSMVEAMRDAQAVFEREFGMNDSVFKQFSDSMSQTFSAAQRSTSDFFMAFATGSKRTQDAARDMAVGILQSMAQIATNRLAAQLLNMGMNMAMSAFSGSSNSAYNTSGADAGMLGNNARTTLYNGGPASPALRFNGGGRVPGTNMGRDTVRALLAPDEYVISSRGHRLVGTEMLNEINRGNVAAVRKAPAQPLRRDPDEVNVYVMAPNEKPTLGPKDVLTVIGQDVLTGGATRQLIRQVAVGAL